MKTLETLLAHPLAAALGWALLHFIWQGTLVALLLAGVMRVLQQHSANLRYAISCAALLLMAILPLATILSVNASMPAREGGSLPAASVRKGLPQPLMVETAPDITPTQKQLAADSGPFWPSKLSASFEPLLPRAILLWLLGVAFFSIRLGRAWVYTERLKVRGTRQLEEDWQQALRRLCQQLRVTRPVRLLESTFIVVPTVVGWLRPVILLPVGALTGLSPMQLESIIAHELAHIRRNDYLINLLQAVVETLLFYHPAVWWVSRRIGQERELCCDDLAVAVCGDPLTYARALFEMEQLRAARPQLAVAANGGILMNRIERLVGRRTQPANRFAGWLACLVVLTAVVGIGAGAQILLPASNRVGASLKSTPSSIRGAQASIPVGQINAEQESGLAQDERAVEALLSALQNPAWESRKAAVETLARLNSHRATELLISALRDAHQQVREQAVIGLGKRSDERLAETLAAALTDSEWSVREQAAIALGRIKDERAAESLLRALQDSEWQVREQAARSLGAVGEQHAVEALIAALSDQHAQVREAAAKSLGWIGDQRVREALSQALQDADEQVRKKAVDALGLLKQGGGESSAGLLSRPLTQQSAGLLNPNTKLLWGGSLFVDHPPVQTNLLKPAENQLTAVNLLNVRAPGQEHLPAQEQIAHRYSLSPNARVEVSYILGSVEIEAVDGDNAEVQIVRSARNQADLERFDRINLEPTPSRLVLRGEDSKSNGIEIRHYVRLRLPKTCQVSLYEINGRVSIKGMSGRIRLNEVNGGALIPQVSGELEMQGVNGKIRLGLTGLVPNGIRLRDVGSVELQVAEDTNAELEIGELDAAPLLETPRVNLNRTGEKHFQGRIGVGGPVIRIEDVNGRVSIRNP